MKSLIKDAAKIVESAEDGGFVRGLVVLQTEQGNFITLVNGAGSPELERAAEAACVALGKTPEEEV